jgi:hypothetical protein
VVKRSFFKYGVLKVKCTFSLVLGLFKANLTFYGKAATVGIASGFPQLTRSIESIRVVVKKCESHGDNHFTRQV